MGFRVSGLWGSGSRVYCIQAGFRGLLGSGFRVFGVPGVGSIAFRQGLRSSRFRVSTRTLTDAGTASRSDVATVSGFRVFGVPGVGSFELRV